VTYGFEAWTLSCRDEKHLRILRNIFGLEKNEDGSWRTRMNYVLEELIENADIVRFMKNRRIAWLGHVMRIDIRRTPKKILEWKPIGTRIRGRSRKRLIVDIEEDMQIIGMKEWRKQCKERAEWKRITEKAKTHGGCNSSKRRRRRRRRNIFYVRQDLVPTSMALIYILPM